MRAVWLREFGPPSALAPGEAPAPTGDVIEVEFANITFVETQIRAGRGPFEVELPMIPGNGVGGLLNGRRVNEGEQIGVVSNYLDRPAGTSRHLHFDVQVFTRDGWLWVNPYTTLVSAYERRLHARGREIGNEPVTAAAIAHVLPEAVRPDLREGGEN